MNPPDDPRPDWPEPVESIFANLRKHVLERMAAMPKNADGSLTFTYDQLGITLLAATLQLTRELKCKPEDVRRCISAVLDVTVIENKPVSLC